MSIENTLERIATALEQIAGSHTRPVEETPKPARSAARPKTTSPTADISEETPSGEVKDEQPPASATAEAPSSFDYEADVKPLILKIGAQKGRDAILSLLGEYGVKSGQELTEDQYEAFATSAKEVLG